MKCIGKKVVLEPGTRFGRLVVIREAAERIRGGYAYVCACECGNEVTVPTKDLNRKNTRSCGCLMRDTTRARSTIHGHARRGALTPEFSSWRSMLKRCTDPNSNRYAHYAGRGIRVCERWLQFESFLSDMGPRPPGTSLERKQNNGNYELANCVWATPAQQSRNTRRTRLLTFRGDTLCMMDWGERFGVRWRLLQYYLARNEWNADAVFPRFADRER